ncbi:hypothetical protein J4429_00265 [Candidatus Pacearchaeota archaeon]|nr:hypothetical protein [Candidatus Pacearchaeota archaeon]
MPSESIEHLELKRKAREILTNKYGFKDNEITEEYPHILSNGVRIEIDVFAKNSNGLKAIECGSVSKLKLITMKNEFGKENVIHIPYSEAVLKSLFYGDKDLSSKKQLLKAVFNEEIYEKLKEDKDYGFLEYNDKNKDYFYIGRFESWMAFPTNRSIIDGRKLMYEINFTISYIDKETYEITINAETNDSVSQYIELTDNTKDKIFDELKKLPSNFFTQDGIKFKTEKRRLPPLPRNWEVTEPTPCNQLTKEKLIEIENRLKWYLSEGGKFEEYPILSLVRINVRKKDLAKTLLILKPIYLLSFKFKTKKEEKAVHDSLESLKQRRNAILSGFIPEATQEEYEDLEVQIAKMQKELDE